VKSWRFIPYEEFDGAMNMAIDEAILEAHLAGMVPPTVRLYGWAPPAVTIGYAQKMTPDVVQRINEEGFEVVRRPTGGRAVLHLNELTYSFVGTSADPSGEDPCMVPSVVPSMDPSVAYPHKSAGFLKPSILGAYKQICQGLILALQQLGVNTELGESDSSYRQLQDCFLATTTADLHYHGKKMVGSAQARRGNGVLQHGSILLRQEQDLMDRLLTGGDTTVKAKSLQRHANLFDILGKQVAYDDIQDAIRRGFEQAFDCSMQQSSLCAAELEHARQLRERYVVDGSKHERCVTSPLV